MDDFIYEEININSARRNVSLGIFMKERIYASPRIEIYNSEAFGRCLYLDNSLQTTEKDEHIYHECLAHTALYLHPNPRNILIIGGGDGGTLREVLRHHSVENVTLCEINPEVVSACKEHFPSMKLNESLNDSRVRVVYADGAEFIKEGREYDVVLVDCPDPSPESNPLFTTDFFSRAASAMRLVKEGLKREGVFSIQIGNAFIKEKFVKDAIYRLEQVFKQVKYFYAPIPSYPSGGIGFLIATDLPNAQFQVPLQAPTYSDFKYLNSETLAAGYLMKPQSLVRNLRMRAYKWHSSEFNWHSVHQFGMEKYQKIIKPFLDLHFEPHSIDRQHTLMGISHKIENGTVVSRALSLFTVENGHKVEGGLEQVRTGGYDIPWNGVTLHSNKNIDFHVIITIDNLKGCHPWLAARKPELCFSKCVLTSSYDENLTFLGHSVKFATLTSEIVVNTQGSFTKERVRNNTENWMEKVGTTGLAEIRKFLNQDFFLDSVEFVDKDNLTLHFGVPYEIS